MIRRLLIASALIVGSAAVAPSAFALDTENVPFEGTVVGKCSFPGLPGGGTLVNPVADTLTSSSASGGTYGTAVVRCEGTDGKLSITGVTKVSGPTLTNPQYSATATSPLLSTAVFDTNGTNIPMLVPPGGSFPLYVDMTVTNGVALTAGSYGFTVDLVVTP